MFTLTDNALLAFYYDYRVVVLLIGFLIAVPAAVLLVRGRLGTKPAVTATLVAYGMGVTLGVILLVTTPEQGNIDEDAVYSAIEDQTRLESVEAVDTPWAGRPVARVIDGSEIQQDSPELIGYYDGVEVTFKATVDGSTGDLTDLVVVSPATVVSADDLTKTVVEEALELMQSND